MNHLVSLVLTNFYFRVKETMLKKTSDLLAQTRQAGRKYHDEAQKSRLQILVMRIIQNL